MTTALPVDPSECTKYETEYGAGKLSGCLVNSSLSFGPFEIDGIAMAAATEIGDKLMVHGKSFRLALSPRSPLVVEPRNSICPYHVGL